MEKLATPSGPSELTTKNLGSPRNSRSSDVLGIQKTDLFKHRFQQKQSFRIIPDGMTSLEDQNVQTKPVSVSNLLEIYPNSIPHKDLIFTAFPFGFSTHPPLQGSFSRNLHIHEDSSHMLSGFPGSHSVQGFPAYDSSGKTFTKSVEDQHHPTIELPTYKTQYVDISPENPKGSTGKNGESEKMLQWRYANLALVLRSKDVTADGSVWEWTSDEVLGYLMWMLPSNVVSFKVFSRFIWENI